MGSIGTESAGQPLPREIEVEHVDGSRLGLGTRMTDRVGLARLEEVVFTTAE